MANVPVLTTTADLAASQIAGAASALLPSGVVLPFAGSSAPSGWLLCDGSEISQTTYASLFAVLSTTYNTQTDPTTGSAWAAPSGGNFRVPDYRGSFLRGVGTFTDGIGTNTSLGGYQADQMQGHTHNIVSGGGTGGAQKQITGVAANGGAPAPGENSGYLGAPIVYADGTPRAGKETRVRNKGVNYIIKI